MFQDIGRGMSETGSFYAAGRHIISTKAIHARCMIAGVLPCKGCSGKCSFKTYRDNCPKTRRAVALTPRAGAVNPTNSPQPCYHFSRRGSRFLMYRGVTNFSSSSPGQEHRTRP